MLHNVETPASRQLAGVPKSVRASKPNTPEPKPAAANEQVRLIEAVGRWHDSLRHGPDWAVVLGRDLGRSGSAAELQEAIVSVKAELACHPASRRAFTAGFSEGRRQVLA
jgi:hypothetical protein